MNAINTLLLLLLLLLWEQLLHFQKTAKVVHAPTSRMCSSNLASWAELGPHLLQPPQKLLLQLLEQPVGAREA
jgi:hypothetical protein